MNGENRDPPEVLEHRRQLIQIEELCDHFEISWKAGERLCIEEIVASAPPELRERLRTGLVELEIELSRQARETCSEEEFKESTIFFVPSCVPETGSPGQVSTKPLFGPPAVWSDLPACIGKYRVIARLGEGGQGEVFRAVHPVLGRDVVIKRAVRVNREAAEKLIDEARILVRLDDPGLVRVLDVDMDDGRPFVVFEYAEGRTLAEVLRDDRRGYRWLAGVVAELADTVERCHRRGVLHRDLKPANVLINAAGRPRLLDFGLATFSQVWSDGVAAGGARAGTPAYMAPEQASGRFVDLKHVEHICPETVRQTLKKTS